MGRLKKPKELKKAQGTYKPSRDNLDAPRFSVVIDVDPPDYLSERAQQVWEDMVEELQRFNLLQATDLNLLAIYCQSINQFWECKEKVQELGLVEDGSRGKILSPYERAADLAYKRAMEIAKRFGFSPVDRMNLKIPGKTVNKSRMAQLRKPIK